MSEWPQVVQLRKELAVEGKRRRKAERELKAAQSRPLDFVPALNTEQAAIYTGLAPATLEGLRSRGGGPRFIRYGRKAVRYLARDLDLWMAARTVSRTSD